MLVPRCSVAWLAPDTAVFCCAVADRQASICSSLALPRLLYFVSTDKSRCRVLNRHN
jgi:hypothetical protein